VNDNQNNIFKNKNYLEVIYSSNRRPSSDYPIKLASYIKKHFFNNSGNHLLDIGCGRGDMLHAFAQLGFQVSGADLSPISKDLISPHHFFEVDLAVDKFPVGDGSFSNVFSKSVIEHMQNPMPLFKEAHRVLSPGGTAVIMTPSWLHNHWGPFYLDTTHVTPFTKPSLRDSMELAGFSNIKIYHFYQLPFLWKFKWLTPLVKAIALLPIPYSPMHDVIWPTKINKFIRFSNEVMLLAVGTKTN
jgi:SAM-dependent methyltransferase